MMNKTELAAKLAFEKEVAGRFQAIEDKLDIKANEIVREIKTIVLGSIDELEIRELQRVYPAKIKGNTLASQLLGISANALCQRLANGWYKENLHFKKKSDRIYIWDRDALIEERMKL